MRVPPVDVMAGWSVIFGEDRKRIDDACEAE
jgi:hypothetical protein